MRVTLNSDEESFITFKINKEKKKVTKEVVTYF